MVSSSSVSFELVHHQVRARFGEGGAVERHAVMPVSWGADHRVVDGATLARFTNTWKRYLEAPEALLVRGR